MPADLTTELRWFFDGGLPDGVLSWFTHDGATGLAEARRDRYRLDGEVGVGVKRRDGTVLELKRRQGPAVRHLHRELDGHLEIWRRWSPADDLVQLDEDTTWLSVDKEIIKRRVTSGGREFPLTEETRAMTGQGCDAEIAGISVTGRSTWTFALAAFGPADDHRSLLDTAWDLLVRDRARPRQLRLEAANSRGYPEWIAGSRPLSPGSSGRTRSR